MSLLGNNDSDHTVHNGLSCINKICNYYGNPQQAMARFGIVTYFNICLLRTLVAQKFYGEKLDKCLGIINSSNILPPLIFFEQQYCNYDDYEI